MELTDELRVAVPLERAWAALAGIGRTGAIDVAVGTETRRYHGRLWVLERSAPDQAVLRAEASAAAGGGDVAATARVTLSPDGAGTRLEITTDLELSGPGAGLDGEVVACAWTAVLRRAAEGLEAEARATPGVVEPSDGEAVEAPAAVPVVAAARPPGGPAAVDPVSIVTIRRGRAATRAAPAAAAVAVLWLAGVFLRRRRR